MSINLISKLYIGYFGRAGDPAGLDYWLQQMSSENESPMSLADIAQSFSVQPESTEQYPFLADPSADPEPFLLSVYKNLFNRDSIDTEGLNYWKDQIASGRPIGLIIIDIISGAQGADAVMVENKAQVAAYYTEQYKAREAEWNTGDIDAAKAVLNGVTDDAATVESGKSAVDTAITEDLTPPNQAPVASGPVELEAILEGADAIILTADQLLANVTDADGDTPSIADVKLADETAGELIANEDGTWSFKPELNFNGTATFTVTVTDGKDSIETSATLEVTPVNDFPVAGEPVVLEASPEDVPVILTSAQLLANASDVDGDELTVTEVSVDEAFGTVSSNEDGTWTFTPAKDFEGTVEFTYTVSDGQDQNQGSATLELTPVNDAPVITGAETTRIGEEMFEINGFGIQATEWLAVTENAVVTDAEGNFAGGSIRIEASGKIGNHTLEGGVIPTEGMGIFPALKEGDEVVGKFYAVGSNLVMRAGVVGNTVDTVIGTYKAGFVDGQVQGEEGFGKHDAGEATFATVTLNGNATSEIVTELLKNIRLGYVDSEDQGDMNVKVTVTDGNGESDSFTRLLDVEGAATMTADDEDESPFVSVEEVELAERTNHFLAPEGVDFDPNGSVMDGATITVTGSNWVDTLRLVATDASIEEGQARFILNVDGTYDVSVKVETESGVQEVVIGTTAALPKAGDQLVITLNENASDNTVEALLNSLTVDMSADLGERTFTVVYESAKGPNELVSTDRVEIQMTRTVVGDFKEVTMAALIAATALSPVTIDSNTRITLSGTQALDIEQAIEDGKIIVSGGDHLIRLISASDSDISGVTGLDLLGTYSFHDIDGDLTITAEQADGRKANVTAGHTLTVTGVENLPGLDLSKLDAGKGSIVAELEATTDVTFSGDLGNASMTVTGPGELTVSADLSTGKTITFTTGTIVITDFGTSPYDLSKVTAAHVTTAVSSDLTIDKAANLGDLELSVAQNVTLTLTATQADERIILGGDVDGNGNKGASIIVTDLATGIDLSNIEVSDILVGATNATKSDLIVKVTGLEATAVEGVVEANGLDLGDFVVQIDEGATLKTDGGSISGESIQGAGSIIVLATGPSINVDLSKVTVTGSKTLEVAAAAGVQPVLAGGAAIGDFEVKVGNDAIFSLAAAQANGKTITGANAVADDPNTTGVDEQADGGSITVTLSSNAAYDLSKIKAGAASAENAGDAGELVAIATDDVILDANAKLGDFAIEMRDGNGGDNNASLKLSAEQADERVVSFNSGTLTGSVTVTVTGLAADTDLSGIAKAADVTAEVGNDLDVSANTNLLGYVDTYKVLDGKVLTLSALQADGVSISGTADSDNATAEGTVVIAGDIVATDTDNNGSIGLAEEITVNLEGVGLGLSFDDGSIDVGVGVTLELTAAQANGKVITGAGNVTVTGLGSTAVDLSQITVAGTKTAEVSQSSSLNSATKLGTFGLDLAANVTLTLSASQASGIDEINGSSGAVIINGTAVADNLDFSGKNGWDFQSLTINGSGGNDYLKAPADVETITFNGGLGSDNFDVASGQTVTVRDFSLTADELNIDANGTAQITVSGTADLSVVESADRLENRGTLELDLSSGPATITASSGKDVFLFETTSFENGSETEITGFVSGTDKLDLSSLAQGAASGELVFVNGSFTGTTPLFPDPDTDLGQVRFETVGCDTVVQIDRGGDGVMDSGFSIMLVGVSLTQNDLILSKDAIG